MNKQKTILVVDDEKRIVELTSMVLKSRGYAVLEGKNGKEAVSITKSMNPDLILLDLMMPEMDGFTACKEIRKISKCPIIMVTAKGEDYDQVYGLESGADDYIVKPYTPMVLVARIEACIRRSIDSSSIDSQVMGEIVLDKNSRDVLINGSKIDLNRKEYDLLVYLAENQGISISRDQILEKVWGYDYLGSESTVDTHVNRLRKKLGDYNKYLKTVRGYGYRFEVFYED